MPFMSEVQLGGKHDWQAEQKQSSSTLHSPYPAKFFSFHDSIICTDRVNL